MDYTIMEFARKIIKNCLKIFPKSGSTYYNTFKDVSKFLFHFPDISKNLKTSKIFLHQQNLTFNIKFKMDLKFLYCVSLSKKLL